MRAVCHPGPPKAQKVRIGRVNKGVGTISLYRQSQPFTLWTWLGPKVPFKGLNGAGRGKQKEESTWTGWYMMAELGEGDMERSGKLWQLKPD